jgi:heme exporter protein B
VGMEKVFALIKKEFLLEYRGKENFFLYLTNILSLSVICSAGVSISFLDPFLTTRILPIFLWSVFFFASVLSSYRAQENEVASRAFEGVLFTGVPPSSIFTAKCVFHACHFGIGLIVTAGALGVLLGVSLWEVWVPLGGVFVLVAVGFSALSVTMFGVGGFSRVRGAMLPLLILPLVFPLLFAALELTTMILARESVGIDSVWISLLVGLDTVYFLLGFHLYRLVLYD